MPLPRWLLGNGVPPCCRRRWGCWRGCTMLMAGWSPSRLAKRKRCCPPACTICESNQWCAPPLLQLTRPLVHQLQVSDTPSVPSASRKSCLRCWPGASQSCMIICEASMYAELPSAEVVLAWTSACALPAISFRQHCCVSMTGTPCVGSPAVWRSSCTTASAAHQSMQRAGSKRLLGQADAHTQAVLVQCIVCVCKEVCVGQCISGVMARRSR